MGLFSRGHPGGHGLRRLLCQFHRRPRKFELSLGGNDSQKTLSRRCEDVQSLAFVAPSRQLPLDFSHARAPVAFSTELKLLLQHQAGFSGVGTGTIPVELLDLDAELGVGEAVGLQDPGLGGAYLVREGLQLRAPGQGRGECLVQMQRACRFSCRFRGWCCRPIFTGGGSGRVGGGAQRAAFFFRDRATRLFAEVASEGPAGGGKTSALSDAEMVDRYLRDAEEITDSIFLRRRVMESSADVMAQPISTGLVSRSQGSSLN